MKVKILSKDNDVDWLYVNKLIHDKGVKLFSPQQSIVTFDRGKKLLEWCQNRYTNINGNSLELLDIRPSTYCDTRKFYINFMSESTPPSEQCSDYFKRFGDSGFNPYTHKQDFSIFEMVYYIAIELNLKNEFEYSNEFIDKIIKTEEK